MLGIHQTTVPDSHNLFRIVRFTSSLLFRDSSLYRIVMVVLHTLVGPSHLDLDGPDVSTRSRP